MTDTTPQTSVLVISSLVATSEVGGGVTAQVLTASSIRPHFVPTVMLGRHPALGAPGGGPVPTDLMASALDGVRANGALDNVDAIFTGYFQNPDQVRLAAGLIAEARASRPDLLVMVDPILGDGEADGGDAGLYISAETARALRDELLPLASVITPNRFELAWLASAPVRTPEEAVKAARGLAPVVLCTSAPADLNDVAVITVTAEDAFSARMPRIDPAPFGTGDVFAASALAERLSGARWRDAAARGMARISHVLDETRLAGETADLRLTRETLQTPLRAPVLRRVGAQRPAWVMGLDGCKAGWAGVMVDLNGIEAPRRAVFERFQDAFDWGAQVIAVDMPIGFEEQPSSPPGRTCEREARQLLGARRSSIFPSPLRMALSASDYEQANQFNRAAGGQGLSKQAFNLFPKIREIDALMTPELSRGVVFETHPEVSFTVLSGAPAEHRKKTREGRRERLDLLIREGLPEALFEPHPFKSSLCAPDDLIDAGLCVLTAQRIAAGEARRLPQDPPEDGCGLIMAIHA
jgi:pyridoxal kinase